MKLVIFTVLMVAFMALFEPLYDIRAIWRRGKQKARKKAQQGALDAISRGEGGSLFK